MKKFMDEDFLLSSEAAKTLYHKYAKDMPIIDYHCHIPPREIAEDKNYDSITTLWLAGDHYKWRLMRVNGIDERYITGDASDFEKFNAFASVLEGAVGNPLYHWSHLELQRYFDIDEELNQESAKRIFEECNKKLRNGDLSAHKIIKDSNVACVGTTDDPIDDLKWHRLIQEGGKVASVVIPTFRPDQLFQADGNLFCAYVKQLDEVSNREIHHINDLYETLRSRMDLFDEMGCKSSDHGMEEIPYVMVEDSEIERIFDCLMNGEMITETEKKAFVTAVMLFLGREYAKRGWVMQLHFGVVRNTNEKMFKAIGKDTGFDRIRGNVSVDGLAKYLNHLDRENTLPKTVLYSLDPNDNAVLDVLCGCFFETGVKGKVQHGAAWWFNDHLPGMREHLEDLASRGLLSSFVGMLTDSRSMLSYTRHEYFRRILCEFIGNKVENGEFAWNEERLGKMVQNISYYNAKEYFGL